MNRKTITSLINDIRGMGLEVNESSVRSFCSIFKKISKAQSFEGCKDKNVFKDLLLILKILAARPELQYALLGKDPKIDLEQLVELESKSREERLTETRGHKRIIDNGKAEKLFQAYFNILKIANVFEDITKFKMAVNSRNIKHGLALKTYNSCTRKIDVIVDNLKRNENIRNKPFITDCLSKARGLLRGKEGCFLNLNNLKPEDCLNEGEILDLESQGRWEIRQEMDKLYLPPLWTIYSVEIYITLAIIQLVIDCFNIFLRYKVGDENNNFQFKMHYLGVDLKKLKEIFISLGQNVKYLLRKDAFKILKNWPKEYDGHLVGIEQSLYNDHIELTCALHNLVYWFRCAYTNSSVSFEQFGCYIQHITVREDFYTNFQIVDRVLSDAIARLKVKADYVQDFIQDIEGCLIKLKFNDYNLGVNLFGMSEMSKYSELFNYLLIINNPERKRQWQQMMEFYCQQMLQSYGAGQINTEEAQEESVPEVILMLPAPTAKIENHEEETPAEQTSEDTVVPEQEPDSSDVDEAGYFTMQQYLSIYDDINDVRDEECYLGGTEWGETLQEPPKDRMPESNPFTAVPEQRKKKIVEKKKKVVMKKESSESKKDAKCIYCGNMISDNSTVCPHCGLPQEMEFS